MWVPEKRRTANGVCASRWPGVRSRKEVDAEAASARLVPRAGVMEREEEVGRCRGGEPWRVEAAVMARLWAGMRAVLPRTGDVKPAHRLQFVAHDRLVWHGDEQTSKVHLLPCAWSCRVWSCGWGWWCGLALLL